MINSFTLSQLIEMSGDNRQGLIRECFTASSDNRMEIFRFPCRIDAFVIGVGTEGETSVSLNLHEYRLKKNSIFIFSPKNILQVKSEEYFKADVIVVSPDFLRRINIDTKNLLQLFLQFAANPCLTRSRTRKATRYAVSSRRSSVKPGAKKPISRTILSTG